MRWLAAASGSCLLFLAAALGTRLLFQDTTLFAVVIAWAIVTLTIFGTYLQARSEGRTVSEATDAMRASLRRR